MPSKIRVALLLAFACISLSAHAEIAASKNCESLQTVTAADIARIKNSTTNTIKNEYGYTIQMSDEDALRDAKYKANKAYINCSMDQALGRMAAADQERRQRLQRQAALNAITESTESWHSSFQATSNAYAAAAQNGERSIQMQNQFIQDEEHRQREENQRKQAEVQQAQIRQLQNEQSRLNARSPAERLVDCGRASTCAGAFAIGQ